MFGQNTLWVDMASCHPEGAFSMFHIYPNSVKAVDGIGLQMCLIVESTRMASPPFYPSLGRDAVLRNQVIVMYLL